MGMLHVILRDGLENQQFIEKHTTGFEAVKESVPAWNPHAAAEKTGVPPEAIENAAHWFAKADHAIALTRARNRAPIKGRGELSGGHQSGSGDRPLGARRFGLRDDHRPRQRSGRP